MTESLGESKFESYGWKLIGSGISVHNIIFYLYGFEGFSNEYIKIELSNNILVSWYRETNRE